MSNTDFLKVSADDGVAAIGQRLLGNPTAPAAAGVDARPGEARVVDPKTFDQHSVGFSDIMQEQTACFVRSRWGDDRTETVVIERGGKTIGTAAVVVLTVPLVGGGVAIVKWGPLWRRSGEPADPRLLEACLSALWREYVERRGYYLTVMPYSDPVWSWETENILLKLGFHRGASLPSPDRYLVNVALDAEELRKSLDQKWRYNLKKAAKHQFNIEIVGAADGLDRFTGLYAQMMERKRFNDTSAVHTLPDILRSDVDALQPMIVMVRHDGRDTAGAVVDTSGERAVYLYGATDDRALPLKAGYALHWWIAERLCSLPQVCWYDLGGSDGDMGLHQFKKGFVGKQGVMLPTPPDYHGCATLKSALTGKAVYAVRSAKRAVSNLKHNLKPG